MSYNVFSPVVTNGIVMYLDASNQKSYTIGSSTWLDLSVNLNDLTLINNPTYSLPNAGSILFDGVDDYGTTVSSASFNYGVGDFTWELWLNANTLSSNHYVIDHDLGGGNGGVIHWYTGVLAYYNSTTGLGSPLYYIGFGNNFLVNTWYHIVASRISGTTYLYTNGELITYDVDAHNFPTEELVIGNYGGGGYYTWDGLISNIKIYNGKGLTQTEVLQNYNALKNRFA